MGKLLYIQRHAIREGGQTSLDHHETIFTVECAEELSHCMSVHIPAAFVMLL